MAERSTKQLTAEQRQAQERATFERRSQEHLAELAAGADNEEHLVSDLMSAATVLLGVTPEALAGAAALSGWEMDRTVTLDAARRAVQDFMSTPA